MIALSVVLIAALTTADADPGLSVTAIARDGHVLVSFDLAQAITPDVRDAIQSGLPTTFAYDVELRRGSSWFDRTVAAVTVSATVRYDNLTRRYQMSRSVDGRVEEAKPTEEPSAIAGWMTHFERIPVSATSALEANGEYFVRVRARTRPRNGFFFWPWSGTILGNATFTFIP